MLKPQNITTSATGNLPTETFLSETLDSLTYSDRHFLWAGCLDATELIPVGGVKVVFIHGVNEGAVTRTTVR